MTQYSGSCHCGQIKYKADLDISSVLSCNCSICTKTGALWAFTAASNVVIDTGQDRLAGYQFGQKRLTHRFCPSCGVETFAEGKMPDGTPSYGINVRTLEGVEIGHLTLKHYDGRSK